MTDAKYTPGPWQRHYSSSSPDGWVIGGEGFAPVIVFVTRDEEDDMPGATVEANARLIAAAPELLAALQSIIDRVSDSSDELSLTLLDAVHDIAIAAVDKAEGRKP